MTAGVLAIDDLDLRLDGTTVWFDAEGSRHEVHLQSIGESEAAAAVAAIDERVRSGMSLVDSIAVAEATEPRAHHMLRTATARGATILDDAHGADRGDVAAALRTLVQVAPAGSRTVAVLGEFDCDAADFVEEHDAIGRLVVRLNVGQLIAVGSGARHLQSAAGLEGSWDGESLIVGSPEEAYDLLRDDIRENDVVLVKGAATTGLSALGDRLAAPGAIQ